MIILETGLAPPPLPLPFAFLKVNSHRAVLTVLNFKMQLITQPLSLVHLTQHKCKPLIVFHKLCILSL